MWVSWRAADSSKLCQETDYSTLNYKYVICFVAQCGGVLLPSHPPPAQAHPP